MRITESQLRRIIAEEIASLVEAAEDPASATKVDVEGDELLALKALLTKLGSDVSTKVINAVKKEEKLSPSEYQALGETLLSILKAEDNQAIAAMKNLINKIAN